MSLTIYIYDLPPMPRNRSHMVVSRPKPMNIKTALCREFEKDLEDRLQDFIESFAELKAQFDRTKHYIKARYVICTPESDLFTKGGSISSQSVDTDAHKVMRDVLYKAIGIDDKVERDTQFFTPVSADDKWNYEITLQIMDKDILYV